MTVPPSVLDNEKYAESLNDKKLRRRMQYTGIKQRRAVSGEQRTSDLACISAEKLVDKLRWKREEIRYLVFITQNPDIYAPSTAMLIQTKLGLSQDLLAFDVNLGCSGFTSGIQIMAGLLSQNKGKGLVLMGDCQHYAEGTEFSEDSILFGDGAAAVAMEYDEDASDILCSQMTDGTRFKALYSSPKYGHVMDGNEIVLFSLNEVVNSINEFHEHFHVSRENVDVYGLHQAQKIIVQGIAQNCSLPLDKVPVSYDRLGNISSASIPSALCLNKEYITKDVVKIFACGFGIGLAWSSVLFDIKSENILSLIESDYVYPNIM